MTKMTDFLDILFHDGAINNQEYDMINGIYEELEKENEQLKSQKNVI